MSQKNRSAFKDVLTGVFMLSVLSLLVYFTIVISGVDVLRGRERVQLTAHFEEVGGLKDHDAVMFRGTKVGTVEKIELVDGGLDVRLDVDKAVVLRRNCSACVCSLSLLGGNVLQLDEGDGEIIDLDANLIIPGERPIDWMRDLARITANLERFTSSKELNEILVSLKTTSTNVAEIVARVERGEGTLGKLLSKDTKIYDDAETVIANASEITARVKNGEGALGKLLGSDAKIYNDLEAVVANASEITARIKNGEGTLGKLASADAALYDEFRNAVTSFRTACENFNLGEAGGDIKELAAGAKRVLASIEEVSKGLNDGTSTLGRLMREDGIYKEVEGLVLDARQVLDNYRDTTPISTFSSLATGAL